MFYSPRGGRGGTRYILGWGGAVPTLFKTKFPFLIPCLRRLTRNHTLYSLVRRTYAQDVFVQEKIP